MIKYVLSAEIPGWLEAEIQQQQIEANQSVPWGQLWGSREMLN
jgi:hypothetical protein